jgi:hypothetical protein
VNGLFSYEGQTEDELENSFQEAVEDYINLQKKVNKKMPIS